jgi:hypothetical protein
MTGEIMSRLTGLRLRSQSFRQTVLTQEILDGFATNNQRCIAIVDQHRRRPGHPIVIRRHAVIVGTRARNGDDIICVLGGQSGILQSQYPQIHNAYPPR